MDTDLFINATDYSVLFVEEDRLRSYDQIMLLNSLEPRERERERETSGM